MAPESDRMSNNYAKRNRQRIAAYIRTEKDAWGATRRRRQVANKREGVREGS